ncbi:hypothetical protein ABT330_11795 [Streptomyces sp. NPDC000658]|uniref:hypothetical protein n=1 Tax=Streptomyces sp. NPDC000658 TaxID=3154266 RepID=UPI00331F65ED
MPEEDGADEGGAECSAGLLGGGEDAGRAAGEELETVNRFLTVMAGARRKATARLTG